MSESGLMRLLLVEDNRGDAVLLQDMLVRVRPDRFEIA
jgi:hypothetical protein